MSQLVALQVYKLRKGGDNRDHYYSRPFAAYKTFSFKIGETTGTPNLAAISVSENRLFNFIKVDVKPILSVNTRGRVLFCYSTLLTVKCITLLGIISSITWQYMSRFKNDQSRFNPIPKIKGEKFIIPRYYFVG